MRHEDATGSSFPQCGKQVRSHEFFQNITKAPGGKTCHQNLAVFMSGEKYDLRLAGSPPELLRNLNSTHARHRNV